MVIVDRLIGARGDARHILGIPSTEGLEWSESRELERLEVIRGVHFDGFTVSHAEVGLNFVECGFNQCNFSDLKTDGHLWGAEDKWNDCVFERCELRAMIAPANSFKKCRFEGVSVVNFKAHQTLFDGCLFLSSAVAGLKALLIRNSQLLNREFGESKGQILFRDCRFQDVSFRQCYFEGAVFQRCIFINTDANGCSFERVVSDVVWWGTQKVDPFTVFLGKALELIRAKCGRESTVYREFENYMIDYGSGKTMSKDFSACLYNNRVPFTETQKVIEELRKLVATFPF
jgi:uncharacterized protein YjbI with pentapeptide repeats